MNLFRRKKTLIRQTQATEKLTDRQRQALRELPENYLVEIARKADMTRVRGGPVEKLTDQSVLAEVAKDSTVDKDVRKAAVERLTDQSVLAEIANSSATHYRYTWTTTTEQSVCKDCYGYPGGPYDCNWCSQSGATEEIIELHTLDLREVARQRLAELNRLSNP